MKLFVDTSAWLALNNQNDQYHEEAVKRSEIIKKQKIEIITSDYVIDESITIIRYKMSYKAAVVFGNSIISSRIVTILDVTAARRNIAWEIFKKYKDKEFSFTDCTSFAILREMKLKAAFSFDKHFEQMGYCF